MGRRLQFIHHAEPYERFAPGCFNARIGDPWPIQLEDGRRIPAKLVAAQVAIDGRSVKFTVEIDSPN